MQAKLTRYKLRSDQHWSLRIDTDGNFDPETGKIKLWGADGFSYEAGNIGFDATLLESGELEVQVFSQKKIFVPVSA